MAVGVGWANSVGLAISSLCHVHLPTLQDPRSLFPGVGWANHQPLTNRSSIMSICPPYFIR
ncbi:MAG: hypothetical protein F6K26_26500 [Moorea sp. SIO2I5]|nr:hypothetical protein [Moorena sp. SIO2I5]